MLNIQVSSVLTNACTGLSRAEARDAPRWVFTDHQPSAGSLTAISETELFDIHMGFAILHLKEALFSCTCGTLLFGTRLLPGGEEG